MTCKLSLGIQKSMDFDGFLDGMDFVRLFSQKYKYYSHPKISHKPLRFCHSLPNPCLSSSVPSNFFFFLFFKFIKSLWIFVIISCFFVRFCFLFWYDFLSFSMPCFFSFQFLVFFYAMFFFLPISCFFYWFIILWFVVFFFVRFFSLPCFFHFNFLFL